MTVAVFYESCFLADLMLSRVLLSVCTLTQACNSLPGRYPRDEPCSGMTHFLWYQVQVSGGDKWGGLEVEAERGRACGCVEIPACLVC